MAVRTIQCGGLWAGPCFWRDDSGKIWQIKRVDITSDKLDRFSAVIKDSELQRLNFTGSDVISFTCDSLDRVQVSLQLLRERTASAWKNRLRPYSRAITVPVNLPTTIDPNADCDLIIKNENDKLSAKIEQQIKMPRREVLALIKPQVQAYVDAMETVTDWTKRYGNAKVKKQKDLLVLGVNQLNHTLLQEIAKKSKELERIHRHKLVEEEGRLFGERDKYLKLLNETSDYDDYKYLENLANFLYVEALLFKNDEIWTDEVNRAFPNLESDLANFYGKV